MLKQEGFGEVRISGEDRRGDYCKGILRSEAAEIKVICDEQEKESMTDPKIKINDIL